MKTTNETTMNTPRLQFLYLPFNEKPIRATYSYLVIPIYLIKQYRFKYKLKC